uniref:RING-type E3 ubiquitin transferase n=1 Tax=Plectus sambesii TaxID=2011161 RepID=A0A914V8V4_9BILA
MASSIGAEGNSSSGDGDERRFQPGDLFRCPKHVGIIRKNLTQGRVDVSLISNYAQELDGLLGFENVDQKRQITITRHIWKENKLQRCVAACFLRGEKAVVHPDPRFVAFVNGNPSKMEKYEAWCGQLVRIENSVFGMVTVSLVDVESQEGTAKETIDLTPASFIPLLNDFMRYEGCDVYSPPWLEDPQRKFMFERTQKPTPDDLKAFYQSIEIKKADGVDSFLSKYPNAVDVALGPAGETALMYAIKTNELSTVKLLLQCGAKPLHKSEDGLSPFDIFFELEESGDVRILERLLDHTLPDADIVGNNGLTPLLEAVARRRLECVRVLLKSELVNVNAQDKDGRTALHYVILNDNDEESELQYASLLLDHDAKVLIADKSGFTSFHLAAKVGNLRLFKLMVSKDDEVVNVQKGMDGWTALHLATVNGHYEIVEELTQTDRCSTSVKTVDGHTVMYLALAALDVAVYKRRHSGVGKRTSLTDLFRVVDLLVDSGASLGESYSGDNSVIHMAMDQLCLAMVDGRRPRRQTIEKLYMLDKDGKELKLVDDLLPICKAWPQLAVVCFLLAKGANVTLVNTKQMAVLESSPVEIRLLLYSYHKRYSNKSVSSPQMSKDSEEAADSKPACLFCENLPNVKYHPCGHSPPFCSKCSYSSVVISVVSTIVKRCPTCRQPITKQTALDGSSILSQVPPVSDNLKFRQTLSQLEVHFFHSFV